MSIHDNDTITSTPLTPAAIKAIELEASRVFGLRLRHVPEPEQVHDQVELEKPSPKPTKAPPKKAEPKKAEPKKARPKKAEPKKARPKSDSERYDAILELARKKGKIASSADIVHLWDPEQFSDKTRKNKAREALAVLAMQQELEKRGEGPGCYYTPKGE